MDFRDLLADVYSLFKTRIWMQKVEDDSTGYMLPPVVAPVATVKQERMHRYNKSITVNVPMMSGGINNNNNNNSKGKPGRVDSSVDPEEWLPSSFRQDII